MLDIAYKSNAPWNDTHWRVPAFDKLLADARAELDEAKRRTCIWEMQAMLHDQGGALIPAFRDWLDAHNTRVGGHTPHSGFDLDNGRIAEKAWLKV
jgi:peptide/nickel transport system substrate-binding protein